MPSTDAPSPTESQRERRRRRRMSAGSPVKNFLLVLAIVVVFSVGVFLAEGGRELFRVLLHPAALFVIVALTVQYILLKGRDRSRLYKLQAEQTREKRQEDRAFLRDLESRLDDLEHSSDASPAVRERLAQLRRDVERRL